MGRLETVADVDVPLRNARRERLAQMLAQGHTRAEACRLAGYAGTSEGAYAANCNHPETRGRVQSILKKVEQTTVSAVACTRNEIVESLRETRDMARTGTPVLAKDGSETGVYKPDLSAKNKADDILAGMHGFKVDVHREEATDERIENMSPEEVTEFLSTMIEQLDPNLRKKVEASFLKSMQEELPGDGETLQ